MKVTRILARYELFIWLVSAAAASVFFNLRAGGALIPSVAVMALAVYATLRPQHFEPRTALHPAVWIPAGWAAIYIFAAWLTGIWHEEWAFIQRLLPFILIPYIILGYRRWDPPKLRFVFRTFVAVGVMLTLVAVGYAVWRQILLWPRTGQINWYFFYRYDFWDFLHQHPVYMSYFFLTALILVLWKEDLFSPTLRKGMAAVLFIALLLSGSRTGYAVFTIIMAIWIWEKIRREGNYRTAAYAAVFLVLAGWTALRIPIIKEHIYQTFGVTYTYRYFSTPAEKGKRRARHSSRPGLWRTTATLIRRQPFAFRGRTQALDSLWEAFRAHKQTLFLREKYNPHNTYLSLWLYGGPWWLAAYVAVLGVLWFYARRCRHPAGMLFALIWTLGAFTETLFLARGIIFFILFYALFLIDMNLKCGFLPQKKS